jgi:hypothetical protein
VISNLDSISIYGPLTLCTTLQRLALHNAQQHYTAAHRSRSTRRRLDRLLPLAVVLGLHRLFKLSRLVLLEQGSDTPAAAAAITPAEVRASHAPRTRTLSMTSSLPAAASSVCAWEGRPPPACSKTSETRWPGRLVRGQPAWRDATLPSRLYC